MLNAENSPQRFFSQNGYIKLCDFFTSQQLSIIKPCIDDFHQAWCIDNQEFYHTRAVNSSGLTAKSYLTAAQRLTLFKLISDERIVSRVKDIIPDAIFMGTQLFFDPVTPNQANYWHRDPQYHLNIEEQKQALKGPEVLHVRIPLTDERGIEVIPGSHKKWDNEEELQVRMQLDGHVNSEDLPRGKTISLTQGDILIFSANMIHRGLYGHNRLALDLLYCENTPQLIEFITVDHQPPASMLPKLDSSLFL
ncbi:phytanoyl-CoA dioxygenase family protein [Paraglaciecola sp.]|uniref:phytanoyl-CoA dioxygenase family protein n=1 Tax=Paraglaciecola sp. TaxID=1920173 RepID=UPI003EF0E574